MARLSTLLLALAGFLASPALAQDQGPLRLEITEGVIEPVPFAAPGFLASGGAENVAARITDVVAADLTGTGLFREIPPDAFILDVTSFDRSVAYADWKAIDAQALITGAVSRSGDRLTVEFRLFDVFAETPLGEGLRLQGPAGSWRRLAHNVANAVYSRITGEEGYFDSRVVFVSETGPKGNRVTRLARMDYDGANLRYLTGGEALVLAPRVSPGGEEVLFTSYATGFPRIYAMGLAGGGRRALDQQPGDMTFAPRYAPDGRRVVFSLSRRGNTDIYMLDRATGDRRRLTSAPSIETAPSFAPDGRRIVFESDRSGTQQLYVMPATGGQPERISFGEGRYATPVWSPRGDRIAFTKQNAGRFHIGVMRPDGSEERLLTSSFLDEGPSWAPNGRVIMFTRETPGEGGAPGLYSVDISGRNLKRVPTPAAAADPAWAPAP